MQEIWKDIPGYEGFYQISRSGKVKSLTRVIIWRNTLKELKGKTLKPSTNKGYLYIVLYKNGGKKTKKIHQLSAITFLNHKPNKYKIVVDHIDNDRSNNRIENLQLVTHRYNCSKDRKNKSSKYTGVSWCKQHGKWVVFIRLGLKKKNLGLFTSEFRAHLAYQYVLLDIRK